MTHCKKLVVFINKGHQWFLKYVLAQAGHVCGSQNVFLLTDSPGHQHYVTEKQISDYENDDVANFRKSYVHMSSNGLEYERVCWERWFYLRDFMRKEGMDKVIYLDSDCMLYSSHEEIFQLYQECLYCGYMINDMPDDPASSAHVSIWTLKALEDFCDFILKSFSDKQLMRDYESLWDDFKGKKAGGICDMTGLYFFLKYSDKSILNLAKTYNESIFDHNVNMSRNCSSSELFEMSGEQKKITFSKDRAYFILKNTVTQPVKVHAIHFQGASKLLIPIYYRGPRLSISLRERLRILKTIFIRRFLKR